MKKRILLNLEATSYCSASCSMCPRDLVKKNGSMTPELMYKIIEQVNSDFYWEIDFAGRGEPTLNKKLPELISIAKKTDVPVSVVTTAVLMSEDMIDSFEKNLDTIRLSVSSIVKEDFDKVHIGLDHEKIWQNIKNISEVAAAKTTIHLTGGTDIYNSLPQTVEYLRKLNFTNIYLFPLWNRGGNFDSKIDNMRRKELLEKLEVKQAEKEYSAGGKVGFFGDLLLNKIKNFKYCPVGDSSLSVAFNGDILGCFQDFGHTSMLGNINDHSLKQVWLDRKKQLGKMPICVGCDAHKVALF